MVKLINKLNLVIILAIINLTQNILLYYYYYSSSHIMIKILNYSLRIINIITY